MSLKAKLKRLIRMDGPMSVAHYMHHCLHDVQFGYYSRNSGIGRDFITAPEISQVFGELIGLWASHEANQLGICAEWSIAELGPGRGTLMADALRAIGSVDGALQPMAVDLVEASPDLTHVQAERLQDFDLRHHSSISDLPDRPMIIVANEFLDCLPTRQFMTHNGRLHEVLVGLDENGALSFGQSGPLQTTELTSSSEQQLGLEALIAGLAERTAPFRALFIDYGTDGDASGDTLRSFQNGKQIHPLAAPGESDLTVDVDFAAVVREATRCGLQVYGPVDQMTFLLALGIEARMQQIISENKANAEDIFESVKRLVDPEQMGTRFKVVCLTNRADTIPSGFETVGP